jgi:uncharacterized membrane protein YphA (DoxX/SURF4 family)
MRFETLQQKASNASIGIVRMMVGAMWLANANWKRPTEFGGKTGGGLARWIDEGIKNPVFPPYSWFLEHVVRAHLGLFGWFTLLSEALIAALLILGWRTRLVALGGAAMSMGIALTILRTPNEWPWAYYLMVGIHLLLAAIGAGEHLGLDGARTRTGTAKAAWAALGGLGVVAGIAGLIAAIDNPFTAKFGSLVGSRPFEVKLFWFNTLGALLCVLIGVLGVAASFLRNRKLAMAAAGLGVLATLQVLVQWRGSGPAETGGILGGNGGTLCLWLIFAFGFAITAMRGREV